MNILYSINKIVTAALTPAQYRDYWKIWNEKFRHRYDEIFGVDEKGKPRYRIYIPVDDLTFTDNIINEFDFPKYILRLSYIIKSICFGYTDFKDNFLYNILSTKYELSDDWDTVTNDILYIYREIANKEKSINIKNISEIVKNFNIDYDKYIKPFLATFQEDENESYDDFDESEKTSLVYGCLKHGYLLNNKGQQIKIIKLLEKLRYLFLKCTNTDKNLIHEFIDCLNIQINFYNKFSATLIDKNKTSQKYELVISRHPYDVAGMSTDRGWTSCMELPNKKKPHGGSNHHYIKYDIEAGTLVCYFIKAEDHNIKHPMGRVLIKPYISDKSKSIDKRSFVLEFEKQNKNIIANNGKQCAKMLSDLCNLLSSLSSSAIIDRYKWIIDDFTNVSYLYTEFPGHLDTRCRHILIKQNSESIYVTFNDLMYRMQDLVIIYDKILHNNKNEDINKQDEFKDLLAEFDNVCTEMLKINNKLVEEYTEYQKIHADDYQNEKNYLNTESTVYGTFPDKALNILKNWLITKVNIELAGLFIRNNKLYNDISPNMIRVEKQNG